MIYDSLCVIHVVSWYYTYYIYLGIICRWEEFLVELNLILNKKVAERPGVFLLGEGIYFRGNK